MKAHELRVVAEKAELDQKVKKLDAFVRDDNAAFFEVPYEDRQLLADQLRHMRAYSDILAKRIARFSA